jgi:hypothetical protein
VGTGGPWASDRGALYLTGALGNRLVASGGCGPRWLVASGGGGRVSYVQSRRPETKAAQWRVLRQWGDGGREASMGP